MKLHESSLTSLLPTVPEEEGEEGRGDPLAPGVAGPGRAREDRDPEVVLLQVVLPGLVEAAPQRQLALHHGDRSVNLHNLEAELKSLVSPLRTVKSS